MVTDGSWVLTLVFTRDSGGVFDAESREKPDPVLYDIDVGVDVWSLVFFIASNSWRSL